MSNDLFAKPTSRPQPGTAVTPAEVEETHSVNLQLALGLMVCSAVVFVVVMAILASWVGRKS